MAVEDAPVSTTNATPKLAPAVMPRTDGPANGFRKRVCICKPATPSAPPTKRAVMALGSLILRIMPSQARFSCPPDQRVSRISAKGIFTEPSSRLSKNALISRVSNIEICFFKARTLFWVYLRFGLLAGIWVGTTGLAFKRGRLYQFLSGLSVFART